jgi:hypothetical protein
MKCLWCGSAFEPKTAGQVVCDKDRARAAKIPRAVRVAAAKEAARGSSKTT